MTHLHHISLVTPPPIPLLFKAGFGGQFGAKAESMGGHAALRFANKSQGLKIKGKVIAEWEP